jgi:hypothetical protein
MAGIPEYQWFVKTMEKELRDREKAKEEKN